MSAYLELARGVLGAATATMLYDVGATVARFDRLRPFAGPGPWTDDHTTELVHDFLTDGRTPQRLQSLMLRAVDDPSLRAMLEQAVRNYVRDRLRQTDHGAFRRKLRDTLTRADLVELRDIPPEESWALPTTPDTEPWSGDPADLVGAAWSVHAPLLRWRSATRRDPITERDALVDVAVAVIGQAQRPVTTTTMTEVGLRRFALAKTPNVVALDDEPIRASADVEAEVVASDTLAGVVDQLTATELTLIANWDLTVRELGKVIGLKKTATATRVKNLEQKLTVLLPNEPDGDLVWDQLVHVAHTWWDHRTTQSDTPFDDGEGT